MTLLILDCDGVLVDSEMIALDVLAKMLSELGWPIAVAECRLRFMGKSTSDVHAEVEEMLGRPVPPEFGERMKMLLFERLRRELQPVRDVREVISALPYRACVASSSQPERIALSLEVTGLAPLFQRRVFSAAEVRHGKPAPDLFLHVAARLGVAPRQAIVIEDSPAGVTAAHRAGMGVIGFAGASHADSALAAMLSAAGAQEILTRMTELPAAIERLRAASNVAIESMRLLLVVAAALIDADGRVLITKRPEGKQLAGLWEFPGGKVDSGERPEKALIRELAEELGIEVEEACLAPLTFASHAYADFHLLMPLYVCRRWRGMVRAGEAQALKWVKPQNLRDYPMPPADAPLIPALIDLLG